MARAPEPEMSAYDDDEYQALLTAAQPLGQRAVLMILLAGEAGLRIGEIVALRNVDIDLPRGIVHVRRNVWRDVEDMPKGSKGLAIPMTAALRAALSSRSIEGARVLGDTNARKLGLLMRQVARAAGLPETLGLHKLRHTFVTRLMTRGATPAAAMRLGRHANMSTTMRYVHVGSDALVSTLGSLDRGNPLARRDPN
jgi:integrase